jgi:hypothetical protein
MFASVAVIEPPITISHRELPLHHHTYEDTAMAEDKGPFEALTATAEQSAEQITKQTQGAMENYFGWFHRRRVLGE